LQSQQKDFEGICKGKELIGILQKKKEIGSEATGFLLEELLELIASIERFPTIPCLKLDNMSYEFIWYHIYHIQTLKFVNVERSTVSSSGWVGLLL